MTFTGEVDELTNVGDGVKVALTNVRKKGAAAWQTCGPAVPFRVSFKDAKHFPIGRLVKVTLKPV